MIHSVTVYLGAMPGNDPIFMKAAAELGNWIGANGKRLVYGGSKAGLMGELAKSALLAGGEVIGVEPQFFIDAELQLDGLTQLIVTKNMTERKAKMLEIGDAFIAFPGGTGTLEEISEAASKVSLALMSSPVIFYNLNGYYDDLKKMFEKMIACGLSSAGRQKGIYFAENLEQIIEILGN